MLSKITKRDSLACPIHPILRQFCWFLDPNTSGVWVPLSNITASVVVWTSTVSGQHQWTKQDHAAKSMNSGSNLVIYLLIVWYWATCILIKNISFIHPWLLDMSVFALLTSVYHRGRFRYWLRALWLHPLYPSPEPSTQPLGTFPNINIWIYYIKIINI